MHVLGVDLVLESLHGQPVFVVFVFLEGLDGLLLALNALVLSLNFNLLGVLLSEGGLTRFFEFFCGGAFLGLVKLGVEGVDYVI